MSESEQLAKLQSLLADLEPLTWGSGYITPEMRDAATEISVFYRDKARLNDDEAFYTSLVAIGVILTYGKKIVSGSGLAFYLYEARRGRNSLREKELKETSDNRIVWRLGRLIDERIAELEGRSAPKPNENLLERWLALQQLAEENAGSTDRLTRGLVKRVRQLPKPSTEHYDPKLEQQIFSAQKFWPDTGAR